MRKSEGTCVPCFDSGIPPSDTFFSNPPNNECKTQPCTHPAPGQFLKAACTPTADAVFGVCSDYPGRDNVPGNPKNFNADYAGKPYWYCPAGGVPQLLPVNSHPTPDYTSYLCDDGFYRTDQGLCKQCLPGSACLNGQSFLCPRDYYSRGFGNTECTLCTASCPDGQLPVRCLQGATLDRGCVSCNMCGYSEQYGHVCNEDTSAMQYLPTTCTPKASSGAVAVCQ